MLIGEVVNRCTQGALTSAENSFIWKKRETGVCCCMLHLSPLWSYYIFKLKKGHCL